MCLPGIQHFLTPHHRLPLARVVKHRVYPAITQVSPTRITACKRALVMWLLFPLLDEQLTSCPVWTWKCYLLTWRKSVLVFLYQQCHYRRWGSGKWRRAAHINSHYQGPSSHTSISNSLHEDPLSHLWLLLTIKKNLSDQNSYHTQNLASVFGKLGFRSFL